MSDLSAFFAKKKEKKSKKKHIISLDDVGQQLERRVRSQETGEFEVDENELKNAKANENTTSKIPITTAEDSEWIEHTEKPNNIVGFTFKEFTEHLDEQFEKDKKQANNEPNKTWNTVTLTVTETPQPPPQLRTYKAPSARREAPLDIANQEMFPSIAAADEMAEKLKIEEKKKPPPTVSISAAGKPDDQFQEAKKFRPRVLDGIDHKSAGGTGVGRGGFERSGRPTANFEERGGGGGMRGITRAPPPPAAENTISWRNMSNAPVATTSVSRSNAASSATSTTRGHGGGGGGIIQRSQLPPAVTADNKNANGASSWRSNKQRASPARVVGASSAR